jgi:hypothetical protein
VALPGKAGALMFAPQHGEIKTQGKAKDHMPAGKIAVMLVDAGKSVRRFYQITGDAMNRN